MGLSKFRQRCQTSQRFSRKYFVLFLGALISTICLTEWFSDSLLPVYAQNISDIESIDLPNSKAISSLLDYLPADPKFRIIYAVFATIICLGAFYFVRIIFNRIDQWFLSRQTEEVTSTTSDLSNLSNNLLEELWTKALNLLRRICNLCILYLYLSFVLQLSTWTANWGARLIAYILQLGLVAWKGFVNYLPNLATIIIILIVTRYAIRVAKLLFSALGQESISIPGFYRDWAAPTCRIVVFLCIVIAASITLPLLPGADSPAFQGLTLLAGLLGAFGAKEAVANTIAGLTLIYTRAFQVGDRIEIADFQGTVLEKSLFVTRLITPKNVVVTIPNGTLIQGNIVNYSTSPKERNTPIILHAEITLGYDVPWRKVHKVLIEAAQQT